MTTNHKRRQCGCPCKCNGTVDEEGRCSQCWNRGKGCPRIFAQKSETPNPKPSGARQERKVYLVEAKYNSGWLPQLEAEVNVMPAYAHNEKVRLERKYTGMKFRVRVYRPEKSR